MVTKEEIKDIFVNTGIFIFLITFPIGLFIDYIITFFKWFFSKNEYKECRGIYLNIINEFTKWLP